MVDLWQLMQLHDRAEATNTLCTTPNLSILLRNRTPVLIVVPAAGRHRQLEQFESATRPCSTLS
eukprot:SAG31_NODE_20005_length_586_cov_1.275154_1_plen_63_part_10